MKTGAELKARREELKIKQQDLADQLGISRTQLSRYENGLREADESIIEKWRGILLQVEMEENPSFDRLIDVARKGFKDGVVSYYGQSVSAVNIEANREQRTFNSHFIKDGIEFVQSLYTEEFIIEKISDELRLKSGAELTLSNGINCVYFDDGDRKLRHDDDFYPCNFLILKGATVKQSK